MKQVEEKKSAVGICYRHWGMDGGGADPFLAFLEKRSQEVCLDLSQRIGIYQHTKIVCLLPLGTRFN